MPCILCLETTTTICSVAIIKDQSLIAVKEAPTPNSHSRVLTSFIEEALQRAETDISHLTAVAVSKGPGSYTGLRIGVSTAKGIAYALNIPLIAINTTEALASGAINKIFTEEEYPDPNILLCPMIDARRMEVYNAIYDTSLQTIKETSADIINQDSFSEFLIERKIMFFGDGMAKCRNILSKNSNANFIDNFYPSAKYLTDLATRFDHNQQYENVAYFEPFYLKDFIPGISKVKGL